MLFMPLFSAVHIYGRVLRIIRRQPSQEVKANHAVIPMQYSAVGPRGDSWSLLEPTEVHTIGMDKYLTYITVDQISPVLTPCFV